MRRKKLLTAHNNSLVNLYNPTQLSACRANKDMHTAFQSIRLLNSVPRMTPSVSCTQHHWGKHFPALWKALYMVPHKAVQKLLLSSILERLFYTTGSGFCSFPTTKHWATLWCWAWTDHMWYMTICTTLNLNMNLSIHAMIHNVNIWAPKF